MKTVKGVVEHGRFRVPYRCYGDSENVLLCVSGALQTMAVWRTVARRFSSHFTVIIFDMPGVGRGEILSGSAQVGVDEQLAVVDAVLRAAAPQGGLTLAGSSWGTAVAAAYAAQYPDRIQQLVLSSFGLRTNDALAQVVALAEQAYADRDYARGSDILLAMVGPQISDAYKRQVIAQFENLTDAGASAFLEHCRNVLSLGELTDLVDLSRIRARTLIVNGAEDKIINPHDMYEARRLIDDCECLLVEGVGHFLHFERPQLLDDYEAFMVPPRWSGQSSKRARSASA